VKSDVHSSLFLNCSAQLDEDKGVVYLFKTEQRNFILKNLEAGGIFEAFLSPRIFYDSSSVFLTSSLNSYVFRVKWMDNFRIMNLDRLWNEIRA